MVSTDDSSGTFTMDFQWISEGFSTFTLEALSRENGRKKTKANHRLLGVSPGGLEKPDSTITNSGFITQIGFSIKTKTERKHRIRIHGNALPLECSRGFEKEKEATRKRECDERNTCSKTCTILSRFDVFPCVRCVCV